MFKNFNHYFQDPATPIMDSLIDLHDHLFIFVLSISVFLLWFFIKIISFFIN